MPMKKPTGVGIITKEFLQTYMWNILKICN